VSARRPDGRSHLAIRIEGALLPSDLLRRIVARDAEVEGLRPEDYGLGAGERLNEAISRSWTRLLGVWASYRRALDELPAAESGTTLTRERWLLPLFHELGYGRLSTSGGFEARGKNYPISHVREGIPVHLLSARLDLDVRTRGAAGAAQAAPHSLVQEFLNSSDNHLWGVLSNGLVLRLLRDNVSLTRQAFVEFDLRAIFDSDLYSDFALLWLVAHESRLAGGEPADCWLERWSRAARQRGIRAMDALRDGVERAIEEFGQGFLTHAANTQLREQLRRGTLSGRAYYRILLRLVYRLVFLFTAEDRDLLLRVEDDGSGEARRRYHQYYSTGHLRDLAYRRRGTRHPDLWECLKVVFRALRADSGAPSLGLPGLGSLLWAETPADSWLLENRSLLSAVRHLSQVQADGVTSQVDFRNLGPEELGSVYEALLDLEPQIDSGGASFRLAPGGGSERKTTGSYYTHEALIQATLDGALEPLLDEASEQPDPAAAILSLRVLDPAVGSGHFLIGAAHRMARRLAAVRTGEGEPPPSETRRALRDVVSKCLFGVDRNPMAAELCKVSLWLEALDPGRPLTFLDHHVVAGNSLVGATPALLAADIPDAAFEALEGEEARWVGSLRRQNRAEREGQTSMLPLFVAEAKAEYGSVRDAVASIEAQAEESLRDVREKEHRYAALRESGEFAHARLLADAWCSAFVWPKKEGADPCPTTATLQQLQRDPAAVDPAVVRGIKELAGRYGFFHFHLAFPQVFTLDASTRGPSGWAGGFDLVLGNPPWDTMSPDVKEFFSTYDPAIRSQDGDGQKETMARLLAYDDIRTAWEEHRRELFATVHFIKNSGRYRLFSPGNLGKGDFNTYRFFIESALQLTRERGAVGQVVPDGFYGGANTMAIRQELLDHWQWHRVWGFENRGGTWFPGVHRSLKFALYTAREGGTTEAFSTAFSIESEDRLAEVREGAQLHMRTELVRRFSPEALAIPELQNQLEVDIAAKMFGRWANFGDRAAGPPHRHYMREVDMGTDRALFTEDEGLPVYEGRMVAQYDHRAKGYVSGRGRQAVWEEFPFGAPGKQIQPQWRVPLDRLPDRLGDRPYRYRVGFCDVASPTNERSLVAALLPEGVVAGHSTPTIEFSPPEPFAYAVWVAVANSFAMDFLVRLSVSLHMTYTLVDGLPFPRLAPHHPEARALVPLVLRLTCTSPEMTAFWNACAAVGFVDPVATDAVPGVVDEEARLEVAAQIDAIVAARIYGLTVEEMDYILMTFPIVERRQKAAFGEYRSRRLILERMA
jgi:hypothetical protein